MGKIREREFVHVSGSGYITLVTLIWISFYINLADLANFLNNMINFQTAMVKKKTGLAKINKIKRQDRQIRQVNSKLSLGILCCYKGKNNPFAVMMLLKNSKNLPCRRCWERFS